MKLKYHNNPFNRGFPIRFYKIKLFAHRYGLDSRKTLDIPSAEPSSKKLSWVYLLLTVAFAGLPVVVFCLCFELVGRSTLVKLSAHSNTAGY